jgi:hypothetical protein
VLLESADLDAARRFYETPEYQNAKGLREGAAALNMVAIEGLARVGTGEGRTGSWQNYPPEV